MGRKPNQLILEFFERGPKLEDASNRYQHTCRACGEKFPKGRIDSLTTHLMKKCPAIPIRDRQRAILQFHDLPDLSDNSAGAGNGGHGGDPNGQTMDLPFAPKPAMSALDTLAEVSRHHLDLSDTGAPGQRERRPRRSSSNRSLSGVNGFSAEDFLVQDERSTAGDEIGGNLTDASALPPRPAIHIFQGMRRSPSSTEQLPGISPAQNAAPTAQMISSASPLVLAASAANELQALMPNGGLTMEPELGVPNAGISDKYFHTPARTTSNWPNIQAIDPLLQQEGSKEQTPSQEPTPSRPTPYPRPIAVNPNIQPTHFTTDFSLGAKPSKPKVRGRFSDIRRKEVQEVRKRGACIRCRMLKKPCSGESPCSTCVNVESARLWKQPCIRTRVAEEFDLYSAGLYAVLTFHAIGQVKNQAQFESIPGRIEATHYLESSTFATFPITKGRKSGTSAIDPALLANNGASSDSFTDIEMIDSETDDLAGKLEHYMRRIGPSFHEYEVSSFMKPTLTLAANLNQQNRDGLLARVLELWIATQILADPSVNWLLYKNPSHPPSMTPATIPSSEMDLVGANNSRLPISPLANAESYNLIIIQLLGAAEKRAANLAKNVMNELERRLLQRQQANPFETFLVAIILLACVEKMSWLFRSWENESQNATSLAPETKSEPINDIATALNPPSDVAKPTDDRTSDAQQPTHSRPNPAKWPLDKQPAYYSQQGERFSEILHMLLKMRGIPPRTVPRPADGVLIPAEPPAPAPVARDWFEAVGVTTELLDRRREAAFDRTDCRCWELRFVGKILRPTEG